MRITFLSPVGVVGGAERVLLAAIRGAREHLPAARIDVVLLADGPLRAEAERLGAAVDVVPLPPASPGSATPDSRRGPGSAPWPGSGGPPSARPRRRSASSGGCGPALRRLRPGPDPLQRPEGPRSSPRLARPRGVPVLWHLHDFLSHRPVMARLLRRLSRRRRPAASPSRTRCGGTRRRPCPGWRSRWSATRWTRTTSRRPTATGPGSTASPGCPPAAPGTVRVGLVATYARWKGQDVFLDALARLPATGPPVRGYVVGGPIYATAGSQFTRAELERRAAANGLAGRVGFVPFRPDPADVYRMLDVVVHASTRPEPFGLTIAEAMACGRPVVVAAAGGAAELFTARPRRARPPARRRGGAGRTRSPGWPPTRGCGPGSGPNARRTAVERFSQERYGREIAAVYDAWRRDRTGPGSGSG